MQYSQLGNTGLIVSRLAFGAMAFTQGNKDIASVYKVGSDLANELVSTALDAGINFFDTADAYADGESEILLGAALKKRRSDAIISTKVGFRTGAALIRFIPPPHSLVCRSKPEAFRYGLDRCLYRTS